MQACGKLLNLQLVTKVCYCVWLNLVPGTMHTMLTAQPSQSPIKHSITALLQGVL